MTASPAFEGLTVVELAQGVAAPYCGMMLAQNGADVIKIEPIGYGDWSRGLGRREGDFSAESIVLNRGKRSLALNLKSEEGQRAALAILERADVVIENYRPGVTTRLGLDYERVKAVNPSVVYATVTGFGESGPNRDLPATDTVMQGYTGFMSINRDAAGVPRRLNMLAIDVSTGLYLAQAVATALYRRAVKGEGVHIRTSLLECAMAFQESRIVAEVFDGAAVKPVGAPVGTFRTADGYLSLNARRDNHFRALTDMLGHPEWREDARFASEQQRIVNAAALNALVKPFIAAEPTRYWQEKLADADILHAKVHDYRELMEDPQVCHMEAIGWAEIPGIGKLPATRLPGLPRPSERAAAAATPPRVGEGGRAALADLGFTPERVAALEACGAVRFCD
ncbi:CaiB/BaiF CoA transferase family protein [Acuticoccus mangrovi]|uniref:CoA transferase n=1 Tax=Acuticoccus mangrovi TaxID=2796142 RepID=A0A934MJH9_9HYPH|nr:CoA transferase [Acuticoccus mangrovi]MBJ3774569.1 CoA transferase [Acuticoccus mangrovi]